MKRRTIAVSYQTWWSENRTDYEQICQTAQKFGMPVWATEAGYSGSATHIDPMKWLTAFGFAESYYRAIAWSHASRVYHWALLGNDGAVGKEGERYPMLYALKHFANFIIRGAVLVDSQASDTVIRTLAFLLPDGGQTIILLNTNQAERLISLEGLQAKIIKAIQSQENTFEQQVEISPDGVIRLPPLSITSLQLAP